MPVTRLSVLDGVRAVAADSPHPTQATVQLSLGSVHINYLNWHHYFRPVFGRLPVPNRAWLLVVYFSRQASQRSVYQSRDYHVYVPNT